MIIALHCSIFNVDESGMSLDPTKLNVICQMGIKRLYRIIGGSGLIVPQADGQVLPLYVVYSGKILYLNWISRIKVQHI